MTVKFKKGTNFTNVAKEAGSLLINTSERAVYFDLSSSERIRIGDYQTYANIASIPATASPNALVYAEAENVLCRYNGTTWVQINTNTNTTYTIELGTGDNAGKFRLGHKEIGESSWTYDSWLSFPIRTVTEGTTNGTIAVNGTDVNVHGLDSAAYVTVESLNTTAQGYVTTLDNSLKAVAKSGAASDVSYDATGTTMSSDNVQAALQEAWAAIGSGGTAAVVNVVKKETAESGYIATYEVTQGGNKVGVSINIPKDYLVKSASIKVVTVDDEPYSGAKVGDKYIDFVINSKDGTGEESHIYLPVKDLAHVYTAAPNAEKIQLAISDQDVISASVVANSLGSADFDTTTNTALGKAHTHDNKAELDLVASGDVSKWNNKQDALSFMTEPTSSNKVATAADIDNVLTWIDVDEETIVIEKK